MGNPIPIQQRSVDPYSSYNSDVVNKLTRIVSDGINCLLLPSPMYCKYLSTSTLTVKAGKAIMDDVLIEIEDIIIDFNDSDFFVDDSDETMVDGWHLVVLCYKYEKKSPAPVSSVKIIKPYQKTNQLIYNTETMLLINAVKIELTGGLAIIEILNYDPDDLNRKRVYSGKDSALSFRDINDTGTSDAFSDDDNIAVYTPDGDTSLNLPLISTTSRILRIIKMSADINSVIIQSSGEDTIEGDTSISLKIQYDSVTLLPYPNTNVWIQI